MRLNKIMVKNSSILTVSISKDQCAFLDEHDLSPSELLQRSIDEQIEIWKKYHTEIGKIQQTLESYQKEIKILYTYLEELGKFDEFRKWRGEYVSAI